MTCAEEMELTLNGVTGSSSATGRHNFPLSSSQVSNFFNTLTVIDICFYTLTSDRYMFARILLTNETIKCFYCRTPVSRLIDSIIHRFSFLKKICLQNLFCAIYAAVETRTIDELILLILTSAALCLSTFLVSPLLCTS